MLLPARWLRQAIFVVICGCSASVPPLQFSHAWIELCPRDRVDSCLDSPLLHPQAADSPQLIGQWGRLWPRQKVRPGPLSRRKRHRCPQRAAVRADAMP
jgi:hypothetical protein